MKPAIALKKEDVFRVLERLLRMSIEQNEPFMEPIVMVGGTAMIAHELRKQSFDVDLFVRDFSIDIVRRVETEFRAEYGDAFRIDVTSIENIWGFIMLRDIADAEPDSEIRIEDRCYTLRKLSIEDLFFLKLDSGREKDIADLSILIGHTDMNRLVDRFNIIWKWHGDPDGVLGLADEFVSFMQARGHNPVEIIERLKLPASMIELLAETWEGNLYE